jgi:hypothetical protein
MALAACMALLLCGALRAQEPTKLKVTGGGVKTVVVVESVPFTISAPAGAAFYFWTLPAGVTATDKGDTLEVTEATAGTSLTFAVKYVSADWDAKKFVTSFDRVSVYAGNITPPQPPDDAVPSAALKKAMLDAYSAEADPNKKDYATKYAQVVREIVPILKKTGQIKTAKDFVAAVHNTVNLALKPAEGAAIPAIRQAGGAFVSTRLPREAGAPVDDAYWRAASIAHSQLAQAILEAVRAFP